MNKSEATIGAAPPIHIQKIIWIGIPANLPSIFRAPRYQVIEAEDWRKAARILNNIVKNDGVQVKAILGSYPIDKNEVELLKKFLHFRSTDTQYRFIPVLLTIKPKFSSPQINPIPGIDDYINHQITEDELDRKIKFLKKYKALANRTAWEAEHNSLVAERSFIRLFDRLLKRLLDILISSIALVVLAPLMALIALIIKLESKGSPFYFAYRAGRNYKIFRFYKFRTMVADADKKINQLNHLNQYGTTNGKSPLFFKISNDPRITKFGCFLRNTSLDELPQLLNVLKGDMSLVGNRPLPLYEASTLTTDKYAERFDAPAGITGLWQISKRGQENMSIEERIRLDIDYARKNSFWSDIGIIIQTPKSLLQKENV